MAAPQVKAGAACTKIGQIKTVNYVGLKCTKSGKKLTWKVTSVGAGPQENPPSVSPSFSISQVNGAIEAQVLIPLSFKTSRIEKVVAVLYVKTNSILNRISESEKDLTSWTNTTSFITFRWDLNGQYAEKELSVDVQFGNRFGFSGANLRSTIVRKPVSALPSASPSAAPSTSPSASPSASTTVNQNNAKKKAAEYLRFSSFSRIGLIKQLEFEGFSRLDAEFGTDAQNANWSSQAMKTAANYLAYSSYSYKGLYDQLVYEGFTAEQAKAGVDSTGLTSNSSAVSTPAPESSPSTSTSDACKVSYLSALPFASQKIALTEMKWERSASGYLSALMTLRNDNSMALRLVEFTFSFLNKATIVVTSSTLEGNNHFFIQDDARFNSYDGAKGAWLPNQTRIFKIETNQIMDCSSLTVLSSGFTVKQGIGAS